MNSSLLVPAFVVVALAAMGAVFFGDVFTGGSVTPHGDYANHQTEMNQPSDTDATKASESMASDFSWDDEDSSDDVREPLSTAADREESFVSSTRSEDAPGEVFSTPMDTMSSDINDVAKEDVSSTKDVATGSEDTFNSSDDVEAVSTRVDSDLDSFFNLPKKTKSPSNVVDRTDSSESVDPEFVSSLNVPESVGDTKEAKVEDLSTQLTAAMPKKELSIDAFTFGNGSHQHNEEIDNNFVKESANNKTKSTETEALKLQSVVSEEPSDKDLKASKMQMQNDADEAISGNLEPVETRVRKFKITNPKETTLPVTMSVDGEKITLKPDQTYVINEHDGEVTITFSRGGSFGFENKTLKNGHYRFSVTREAGWKLNN